VHHKSVKHIDIQHHFVREKVESKEVEIKYISTSDMVADILTKPLPRPAFAKHVEAMNLHPSNADIVSPNRNVTNS